MSLIKKLAIPAIILTIFSLNCFSGNGFSCLKGSFFDSPTVDKVRKEDFLPHTFWQQTPEEIVSYLKPQILETEAFRYYPYFISFFVAPNRRTPWSKEEYFKEIIYDRISEFMNGKAEPMPSLEEFKASFNKRACFGYEENGNSNLMTWFGKYLEPIAHEVMIQFEERGEDYYEVVHL